jgi:hypothetical protein
MVTPTSGSPTPPLTETINLFMPAPPTTTTTGRTSTTSPSSTSSSSTGG